MKILFAFALCAALLSVPAADVSCHPMYPPDPFDGIIQKWYQLIDERNTSGLDALLTQDFELIAFGKRFTRQQFLDMSKEYSDLTWQLDSTRHSSSQSVGYITFNITLNCKINGKPVEGHAIEAYLLRKEKGQWLIATKVIVMRE